MALDQHSVTWICCVCLSFQGWLELGEALLDSDAHAALSALVKVSNKEQCTSYSLAFQHSDCIPLSPHSPR